MWGETTSSTRSAESWNWSQIFGRLNERFGPENERERRAGGSMQHRCRQPGATSRPNAPLLLGNPTFRRRMSSPRPECPSTVNRCTSSPFPQPWTNQRNVR